MIRKKRGKFLAAILAAVMLIPQSVMTAGAANEPTPVFTHEETVNVSNGSGAVEPDKTVVNTMTASEDVTINLTFTATGSGVQSLFFMGNSSTANNYIAVYLNGSTLGVESRNTTGGYQIQDTYSVGSDVNLAEQHTLTFTIDSNTSYSFYLDGEKVKSGTASCAFNTNLTSSDYIGFGKGKRSSNDNAYPLTGSLSNIELYNAALADEQIMSYHNGGLEDVVYSSGGQYYPTGTASDAYATEESLEEITALGEGSVTVRYRVESVVDDPQMLVALSDSSKGNEYLGLYVNPYTNVIGLDAQGGSSVFSGKTINLGNGKYSGLGVAINNTNWHTITVTKGDGILQFYVDGVYVDRYSGLGDGFFNLVTSPDIMGIGKAARSGKDNMELTGAIDSVKIYNSVLTGSEIARADSATQWIAEEELDMTDAYKSETEDLFYSGYNGSVAYRIPSLLTTQDGTQLAFIDERNSGAPDYGNIDAVVRRKEADEDTFSDPITLVDLPNNGNSAAFAIDMATVQDQTTGKIFAFVDMFPESSGLMNTGLLTAGVGYEEVGGEMCQILYDNSASTNRTKFGHIRNVENGVGHVLDVNGEDTGYTVIVYPSQAGASLREKGNLYKDGEYKGNIYMLNNGPDKGELCVLNTSYLWMVTSDDDGKTWSDPVDITPQVKEDWCLFFGTGPGVGIQLHAGEHKERLVVPIYTANKNVGGSQSSAVIYSDDNGETWELGESPQKVKNNDRETMNSSGSMFTESQVVQLNNGDVLLFMRNTYGGNKVQMATSKDGGATWESVEATRLTDVYCQLSVIHYSKGDKEYILLSNPTRSNRYNGKLHLGEVQEDGSIAWNWEREINSASERFAYSCLTLTEADETNPKFAIMYEDETTGSFRIRYFEFDENYIKAGTVTPDEMAAPQLLSTDVQIEDGTATIALTFDQTIMVAGTPQLGLSIGSENVTADYKSGSGTDTIVFTAAINTTNGILKFTELNLETGLLENIQNKTFELTEGTALYTNTEIDLSDAEVTYTTQHSNSTAHNTDGAAVNVIDGNPNTYWHSTWGKQSEGIELPQSVTLNLGETKTIYKVDYLARQNNSSGRIREYGIEVSTNGSDYTEVAHGTLPSTTEWQEIEFIPVEAQYIRFVGYEAYSSGTESCSIAELKVHEYSEGVIEQGDEAELQVLVDASAGLTEENYSAVTWEAYEAALATAKAVLATDNPTSQNIIDRTAENLKSAQNALVDISRAVERFAAIRADEENYTPESWAVLEEWMGEHESELNDATTSKDVTDMIVALAYQARQLVEKVDKTELQNLLTNYTVTNPLEEDDYETNSWNDYQAAITEARNVLNSDNASAQDVADAIADLTNARTALKADMTELQTLYDTYSALNESSYLPDSWTAMETALAEADTILTGGTASPAQVQSAIEALKDAFTGLQKRPDTSALQTLYDTLTEVDRSLYMKEGAEALADALTSAKSVLDDPQTAAQVEEEINALNSAYNGLVLKATAEQMQELTDIAVALSQKDTSGLSDEQLRQVETALENVQAALAADEISSVYADSLLKEAEAAMALTAETQEATEEQMQALEDIEALLSQKDMSGLTVTQRQQVESVLERLQTALASGSISSEYAHMLLAEAEAAMALSGDTEQPQNPSEEKPSDNKPAGTDGKTDTADKDKAVKTGDTAEFGWMVLMLAVSVTAAAVVYRRRGGKN